MLIIEREKKGSDANGQRGCASGCFWMSWVDYRKRGMIAQNETSSQPVIVHLYILVDSIHSLFEC